MSPTEQQLATSTTSLETNSSIEALFKELREAVLAKKPVLRQILEKHGEQSLFRYAQDYFDVNINGPIRERQDEFLATFSKSVSRLLGSEAAHSAVNQLRKYFFVSTADHHGPICDPFFLNSNLLTATTYYHNSDPALQNVIVLSCANVSLNNSTFPRGLVYTTNKNGKAERHRLSFLPSNAHSSTVYNFRPYNERDIEKLYDLLRVKVKDGAITQDIANQLNLILKEIYSCAPAMAATSYSDQVTITNDLLWKKFFAKSPDFKPPRLIYLEQESLVIDLLLEHHINHDTIINHFLFDDAYEPMIVDYFNGIMGAFSKDRDWGTYLFWGHSKDSNYRVPLWKEGKYLVSKDGTTKIELTAESLATALKNKELLPSMMLIFLTLSFYYGLKCLGGFSQVNYLTYLKNAYIKMQADLGNYRSIEACARAQTKELGEDMTIALARINGNQELSMATGLDLILYGTDKTWPTLVTQAHNVSLNKAIDQMMPEFYRVAYPGPERDERLMTITPEQISKINNLDKDIEPCITVA